MSDEKVAVVLYDYHSKQDEELTIRKSEKLSVLDDSRTWWLVRNERGQSGFVPSNYVRLEKKSGGGLIGKLNNMMKRTVSSSKAEPTDAATYQQVDLVRTPSGTKSVTAQASRNVAIAKYQYDATREDELSLQKGDHINVEEKEEDGWWKGECKGRSGWFPSNYVEEVVQASLTPNDGLAGSAQSQDVQSSFICVVRALYPFNSGNPEELPFQRGDMMDIVDQPANDPDWWEAIKADGTRGVVPRNYVDVVHDAMPVYPPHQKHFRVQDDDPSDYRPGIDGFHSEEWFHGKISRQVAEQLCNMATIGDFLVRESESASGDYSISMKAPGKVKHFKVKTLESGKLGIGQRKFNTMRELIEHYKRAPIFTTPDGAKYYLVKPFPRRV